MVSTRHSGAHDNGPQHTMNQKRPKLQHSRQEADASEDAGSTRHEPSGGDTPALVNTPPPATKERRLRQRLTTLYESPGWQPPASLSFKGSPFRSQRSRRTRQDRKQRSRSRTRRSFNVEFTEIEVRRSGRKRKMLYDNFSNTWIATQIAHSGTICQQADADDEAEQPSAPASASATVSASASTGGPGSDNDERDAEPTDSGNEQKPGDEEHVRRRGSRRSSGILPPVEDDGMDMYSRVKRTHRPAERYGCDPTAVERRPRRFVVAPDSSSGAGSSSEDDEDEGEDDRAEEARVSSQQETEAGTSGSGPPRHTHGGPHSKADRQETKVIKRYYLRENRREPKFYKDDSMATTSREENFPSAAGWRRHGRHHRHGHVRSAQSVFNESTTDSRSSSGAGDSSDADERSFQRRKARSMQGFRNKCLPMNFSKEDAGMRQSAAGARQRVGGSLADVDPMSIDKDVNFDCIGGLQEHIRDLKEMILLPLLYPDVFSSKNIQPPKGVLFCGPPGTGKTLMARAVANECSLGDRKVAFFMRKGADVLSKWVGESERQLRLLFDQAYQMRPSIIFFDEVDGLAPVRSSKQDYIHSSIVSTLLALMDGVDSRGEVIVIGATNRPDSVDPALRRPGRFDREFHFPLPSTQSREQILRLQTAGWRPAVAPSLVSWLARQTAGYCGADLKHLVTEAVLHALRATYPQIYGSKQRLLIDTNAVQVDASHFRSAMARMTPAAQRDRVCERRLLPAAVRPLLGPALSGARRSLLTLFPWGYKHQADLSGEVALLPRLLLTGAPAGCVAEYLAPALLNSLEDVRLFSFSAARAHAGLAEPLHTLAQLISEAVRSTPSVLYLPRLDSLWRHLADRLGLEQPLLDLLRDIPRRAPLLLLATADTQSLRDGTLPQQVLELFSVPRGQRQTVPPPNTQQRRQLFTRLFMKTALMFKKRKPKKAAEVQLPVAPPAPPPRLGEEELRQIHRREERRLAELRIFLREMCGRLIRNRQFELFRQPVEEEDAPDYYSIIEKPMDLDTIMTKIDQHKYEAAEDWLNDVDLICTNALEYNPDTTDVGREIRHRACMLRDQAHKLIWEQLDSDFEEQCKQIRESRRERAESPTKFAPSYLITPRLYQQQSMGSGTSGGPVSSSLSTEQRQAFSATPTVATTSGARQKSRRRGRWANGILSPRSCKRRRSSLPEEQNLTGELGLSCGSDGAAAAGAPVEAAATSSLRGRKSTPTLPVAAAAAAAVAAAPPDDDSGHGSTSAPPSDEQIGQTLGSRVVVDRAGLLSLRERAVALTTGWQVAALETLHAQLTQVLLRYRHRRQRADMLKDLAEVLDECSA